MTDPTGADTYFDTRMSDPEYAYAKGVADKQAEIVGIVIDVRDNFGDGNVRKWAACSEICRRIEEGDNE